jgi:DNA invertase Pin-like site-specific DNA recombinase
VICRRFGKITSRRGRLINDHYPDTAAPRDGVVLKQQIDTATPTGRLVFHILGTIDEFQRELIIEGTRDGLDAARARGRTGGRKPKLNARRTVTVRRMYQATGPDGKRQHTVAEIAEAVGVHRTTVYDYLRKES